jgi:hypothetical protein
LSRCTRYNDLQTTNRSLLVGWYYIDSNRFESTITVFWWEKCVDLMTVWKKWYSLSPKVDLLTFGSSFAHSSIQTQNVVCRCRRISGAQNQDLPLCRTEHLRIYIHRSILDYRQSEWFWLFSFYEDGIMWVHSGLNNKFYSEKKSVLINCCYNFTKINGDIQNTMHTNVERTTTTEHEKDIN